MGSPLAADLANIFMGFHKSTWLNEYNLNKPKFYLRYVSDILAAFHYFKLPYIANLSTIAEINLPNFAKNFVKKKFNIKLVFNSFKFFFFFSYKNPIAKDLKSFLVYNFTCAGCSSSYIEETCCHFKTRIDENIKKDNKFLIFKDLQPTATCFDSYNSLCFKIIDKAHSKFDLKIKDALHINWRKPKLNAQQNHLALTHYSYFCFPCSFLSLSGFFLLLLFFTFLFDLLFSLSLR